ncbi:MAG: hypothetical protein QGF07_03465, partial [Phycisphaerales bacterium]|nr:hypothetical protein [Phycisphaerales bacterium]
FEQRLLAWCQEYAPEFAAITQFSLFASANHARSKTFRDAIVTSQFLIIDDDELAWVDTKPVKKALLKGEETGLSRMPAIIEAFQGQEAWDSTSIDTCLHSLADELADGNLGKVAQPVRIAVAGGPVSPPIGDTLVLLGKERTLRRLERCQEYFASVCDA